MNKVEIIDGQANVWLSEDQRAFAIGKMGQNIGLAAQLLDVNINLISSGNSEKSSAFEHSEQDVNYDVENNDNN